MSVSALPFHGEGPFFLFMCGFVKQKKSVKPLTYIHPNNLCACACMCAYVCAYLRVCACVYTGTIRCTQGAEAGNLINKHMLTLIIDF